MSGAFVVSIGMLTRFVGQMSEWEIVGSILGVLGVALMIRQNVWAWPVGLAQVLIYAWVFREVQLYSDAILNVCYFVIQAYGWWHWLHGGSHSHAAPLPVTRLRVVEIVGYIALGAVATAAWGSYMATLGAALPYWDAFVLMFALIAQWLQARKKLECWPGWMVVNTVSIGVFWAKGLHITVGLYVIFWLMAVWGWREWRRSMKLPLSAA